MLMTRASKEAIVLTIENFWDWMALFDNGVEDEIEFELNAEILDVFFPDWDLYVDETNPFGSLNMEDINAIKVLHILIATDVKEIEDLEGEGIYEVVGCKCDLSEEGEDTSFEAFLNCTGIATFKVTPNHPVP